MKERGGRTRARRGAFAWGASPGVWGKGGVWGSVLVFAAWGGVAAAEEPGRDWLPRCTRGPSAAPRLPRPPPPGIQMPPGPARQSSLKLRRAPSRAWRGGGLVPSPPPRAGNHASRGCVQPSRLVSLARQTARRPTGCGDGGGFARRVY